MTVLIRKPRSYIYFVIFGICNMIILTGSATISILPISILLLIVSIMCTFEMLYSITTYDIKKWSAKYRTILYLSSVFGIIPAGIAYLIIKREVVFNSVKV